MTFYTFHWTKGTPFNSFDQGGYEKLTWWEQMTQSEMQASSDSPATKFLTIAPILIYCWTLHHTYYSVGLSFLNLVALGFCFFPKLPSMYKKRLFGINE